MAQKRGSSGLSLIVGVDKPSGMTSHDVVNACRRIFGERRVGHTGTLDPLASGVLPVCIGPATRLDAYLSDHDKAYEACVEFGTSTDTDDCEGEIVEQGPIPEELYDPVFALRFAASLIGRHSQMPPAYSAIKIGGRKAYELARAGEEVALKPREIEVYDSRLIRVDGADGDGPLRYRIVFSVSKGTYIRSLARDIGRALGTPAHLCALRRLNVGSLDMTQCVSLEELAEAKTAAALDPVALLERRYAFVPEELKAKTDNGGFIDPGRLRFYEPGVHTPDEECGCTGTLHPSHASCYADEIVSLLTDGSLKALYRFDAAKGLLVPACIFPQPIIRGSNY